MSNQIVVTLIARKNSKYVVREVNVASIEAATRHPKILGALSIINGCSFSLYKTRGSGESEVILETVHGKVKDLELVMD